MHPTRALHPWSRRHRSMHGAARATRRRGLVVAVSLLAGLVLPVLAAPPAHAAGEIFTIAGSLGPANAKAAAFEPARVLATGGDVVVSDDTFRVVRRIDLATGTQAVVAGNGSPTNGDVNVQATTTELYNPEDVIADPAGNLYIADGLAAKVYKLATNGLLTLVAGSGFYGNSGDGGPATAAALKHPTGLAFDTAGNLFIADRDDNRIRRVSVGGTISTFAGTGGAGFSGDGGSPSLAMLNGPNDVEVTPSGTLLIADSKNHRVRSVAGGTITTLAGNGSPTFAGDGGIPTSASLQLPTAVTSTASAVYIADTANNRVRKVAGGVITTVAGGGAGTASQENVAATAVSVPQPTGVSLDGSGNLFIASNSSYRVRKVTSGGTITTVGGNGTQGFFGDGGQATSAELNAPGGVAKDAAGNIYIADTWTGRIRKRSPNGLISTVAGGGNQLGDNKPATDVPLAFPSDVAVDLDGNLYIAENGANRIRKVDANGVITTVAGTGASGFSGDGGFATAATLDFPRAVAVHPDGGLVIADTGNNRIRRVGPDGVITTIAGTGAAAFSGDGGAATAAAFKAPFRVLVDPAGNVLVADSDNDRVRRISSAGIVTTIVGNGTTTFVDGSVATATGLRNPQGLALDEAGDLFVGGDSRVVKVDAVSGVATAVAGTGVDGFSGEGGPATSARMQTPWSLVVEPGGDLVVADYYSHRVRRVIGVGSPGGRFHGVTPTRLLDSRDGTGGFNTPWGPAQTRDLVVTGKAGIPSNGVSSVVLNVTVTGGTSTSHLTVFPTGQSRPLASNLNWPTGDTRPNLVTVKVGTGGKVSIFNNTGNVNVIADVVGWYDDGGSATGDVFTPLTPARVLDSRDGTGGFNTPWAAGTTRDVVVRPAGGVPVGATAVVLNVTVVNGTKDSHLTVWPAGQAKPVASNLNWPAGAVRPNLVVVPVGAGGKVSMFNNAGTVDVLADVVGYFGPTGDRFHPTRPKRLVDSRDGTGTTASPWGAATTRTATVAGIGPVPHTAKAVVLNVTVTGATADSHLTVWPAGVAKPVASNLNWKAGQTVPNLVVVKVGQNGGVSFYNNSGNVDVIADVVGWYG